MKAPVIMPPLDLSDLVPLFALLWLLVPLMEFVRTFQAGGPLSARQLLHTAWRSFHAGAWLTMILVLQQAYRQQAISLRTLVLLLFATLAVLLTADWLIKQRYPEKQPV
jgi:hypothetical protein